MLSQKLILSPEVEINAFSKDDELTGTGKGLSSVEAGLRLRYEVIPSLILSAAFACASSPLSKQAVKNNTLNKIIIVFIFSPVNLAD
jgi:uncharacterized protein involved in copper resistance